MSETEEKNYMFYLLQKMQGSLLSKDEYHYLQFLLMKYESLMRQNYPVCKTVITGDKILFISDTHSGSEYDDEWTVYTSFNEALRRNVKTAVHAGDFTEACAQNYDKPFEVVRDEFLKALSRLPEEMVTKLLLGNHDYSAIRTYREMIPYYFSYPKLDILGMKSVILDWDDIASIQVNHQTSQLGQIEYNPDCLIQMNGHWHLYKVALADRSINLPALCKNSTDEKIRESIKILLDASLVTLPVPTFVIASKVDSSKILFETFYMQRETKQISTRTEKIEADVKTKTLRLYK